MTWSYFFDDGNQSRWWRSRELAAFLFPLRNSFSPDCPVTQTKHTWQRPWWSSCILIWKRPTGYFSVIERSRDRFSPIAGSYTNGEFSYSIHSQRDILPEKHSSIDLYELMGTGRRWQTQLKRHANFYPTIFCHVSSPKSDVFSDQFFFFRAFCPSKIKFEGRDV